MTLPKKSETGILGHSFRILLDRHGIITAEISVADWLLLPALRRQSSAQHHARASQWRLARRATGAVLQRLSHVTAAQFQGTCYKVDGYTRAYLWTTGDLPRPERLHVTVYRVGSEVELDALARAFDVQSTAERNFEKVYSAYHECGLVLQSKRLKEGFIADALNIALRSKTRANQNKKLYKIEVDVFKAVAAFKAELLLLDRVDPQPEIFFSGIIAASFIGLSLYPEQLDFFYKLAAREGNSRAGSHDPVARVLRYIEQIRQQRASWIKAQQEDLCARTVSAFLAWRDGPDSPRYWLKTKLRATGIMPLIVAMKDKKGIRDDPCL